MVIDAHLDLAYNVERGRDVTRPASEQPVADREIATVGLPDLRAGNVGLVCATIFCSPDTYRPTGYSTPQQAHDAALRQYATYTDWIDRGLLRWVRTRADLPPADYHTDPSSPLHAILLLEGADPLRTPADVQPWFDRGLRMVGLAWRATRYAGGTGQPGPLTPAGRELVPELDRHGILHDASHLAEQSFWDLLELSPRTVVATHSNCRAIVPTDRQLSDDMIRAIAQRGGVIGINLYDKFLVPPDQFGKRPCTLDDVVAHVRHICSVTGSARHVALGTDLDGGLGREQIPRQITTIADLSRCGDALATDGFPPADVDAFLSGNWLRVFRDALPA